MFNEHFFSSLRHAKGNDWKTPERHGISHLSKIREKPAKQCFKSYPWAISTSTLPRSALTRENYTFSLLLTARRYWLSPNCMSGHSACRCGAPEAAHRGRPVQDSHYSDRQRYRRSHGVAQNTFSCSQNSATWPAFCFSEPFWTSLALASFLR